VAKQECLTSDQVQTWSEELPRVVQRLGPRFARSEARERLHTYLQGLLSQVPRKNSWQLAQEVGHPTPYGFQHFLQRADWDPEEVREDLMHYVREHFGDPKGVLIVDETGFLKKGTKSCGVARQYSGTAGRIENSQVGVFLAWAGKHGQALMDRALYVPKEWTEDRKRLREAGVPEEIEFATKPQLALDLLKRALEAGIEAAWVCGDEVYGSDYRLRAFLEEKQQGYVLAVRSNQSVWMGMRQHQVGQIVQTIPAGHWQRLSAGAGTKGQRWYHWARVAVNGPDPDTYARWVLVRRSTKDPTEWSYYLCGGDPETSLVKLVQAAGKRWCIESCFEMAKGEVGLDQYEVRSWTGWHRHVTLAMFAFALLGVIRQRAESKGKSPKKGAGFR
jgi:SRSO17 transposase